MGRFERMLDIPQPEQRMDPTASYGCVLQGDGLDSAPWLLSADQRRQRAASRDNARLSQQSLLEKLNTLREQARHEEVA